MFIILEVVSSSCRCSCAPLEMSVSSNSGRSRFGFFACSISSPVNKDDARKDVDDDDDHDDDRDDPAASSSSFSWTVSPVRAPNIPGHVSAWPNVIHASPILLSQQ